MDANPSLAKPTRKRKRSGDSLSENSGDDLKKRGRPKTEKPDASAADVSYIAAQTKEYTRNTDTHQRRRTQIRMAQRAYRQRKESTLDDLRKRVSELMTAAECMNKAFEDCRDRLVMAGLSEGQLDDLAETTVKFSGYMSNARNPGDLHVVAESEVAVPVAATKPSNVTRHSDELSLVPKNVPSWIDQSTLSHTERQNQRSDVGMGYTIYNSGAFDQLAENFRIPTLAHGMHPRYQDMTSSLPTPPEVPMLQPQRSLSSSDELSPPKTYSFHETTLSRRLHRACIEAAYHLLLDPIRRPHTYDRVFKLSLLNRDRARMAASLKKILDRGIDDPLDLWDAPLLHIGGAGTHYPVRGRPTYASEKRTKYHLGMIGPQMLNLLENVAQARPATEVSVEVEGFEGTWFDPYDVEGYLESKGIHIDPTVSFVEAEVTDIPSESSTASSRSSSIHAASAFPNKVMGSNWDPEQWSEMQKLDADMVRWQEMENVQLSGLGNVGFSDADTGSWMNFLSPDMNQEKTATMNAAFDQTGMIGFEQPALQRYGHNTAPPKKKVVIIDVAKFVKGN